MFSRIKVECFPTGHTIWTDIDISKDRAFENFISSVEESSKIHAEQQILLIGPAYEKLNRRNWIDHCLEANQQNRPKRIFLFNREHAVAASSSAASEQEEPLSPCNVRLQFERAYEFLGHSRYPDLNDLLLLEHQFGVIYNSGRERVNTVQARLDSSVACLQQQQVQYDALNAALGNLEELVEKLSVGFGRLELKTWERKEYFQCLLDSYDRCKAELASIALDPALQSLMLTNSDDPNKTFHLIDCIPEMDSWFLLCRQEYGIIVDRASEVSSWINSLKEGVEKIRSSIAAVFRREAMERCVADLTALLKEQIVDKDILLDMLTQARTDVARLIEEICPGFASQQGVEVVLNWAALDSRGPRGAVAAGGGVNETVYKSEEFKRQLAKLYVLLMDRSVHVNRTTHKDMQTRCNSALDLQRQLFEGKKCLTRDGNEILRGIAQLQGDLRPTDQAIDLIRRWYVDPNKFFRFLETVTQLSRNYPEFLKEIVRRRSFDKRYLEYIENSLNHVESMRNEEILERTKFLSTDGLLLPDIFFEWVPSLRQKPQHLNATLTPVQPLPAITDSRCNESTRDESVQSSMVVAAVNNEQSSGRLAELELEVSELRRELAVAREKGDVVTARAETDEMHARLKEIEAAREELQAQRDQLTRDQADWADRQSSLQKDSDDLSAARKALAEQQEQLNKDRSDDRKRLGDREEALHRERLALQKQQKCFEESQTSMLLGHTKKEASVEAIRTQIHEMKENVDRQFIELSEREAYLAEKEKRLLEQQKVLTEREEQMNVKTQECNATLEDLNARYAKCQNDIAELNRKQQEYEIQKKFDQARERSFKETWREEKSSLEQQLRKAHETSESYRRSIDDAKNECQRLVTCIQGIQTIVDDADVEHALEDIMGAGKRDPMEGEVEVQQLIFSIERMRLGLLRMHAKEISETSGGHSQAAFALSGLHRSIFGDNLTTGNDFGGSGGPVIVSEEEEAGLLDVPYAVPPAITLASFQYNDIVLFLPKTLPEGKVFLEAVNIGCPNHYLSTACLEAFREREGFREDRVMGKVVYVEEEQQASESRNPFFLEIGTHYAILNVELMS